MDRITAAQVFIEVAERGSMTAAAAALAMSRAMVTRNLAQMEQWAQARLLHRTTRRLSLTGAGEETLLRCRQLLDIAAAMPASADPGEPHGLLRISCSQSLGQATLARAVAGYLARHPQARVDLQISNRAVNLVEDRIDLAIRITNALDEQLIARRLGTCGSVLCAAPAYLAAHGTPARIGDLAQHNCLTYAYFGKSTWEFAHEGRQVAVPVSGSLTANEDRVLLTAALEGAGITLQPLYSAAPWIDSGQLVALFPAYTPSVMGIHGIYASREHMPPILRGMLDYLVEWFAREQALFQRNPPPAKRRRRAVA
ncbi:MAG: LysR family transcriptional regulator [Telluria sp.]